MQCSGVLHLLKDRLAELLLVDDLYGDLFPLDAMGAELHQACNNSQYSKQAGGANYFGLT